MDKLFFDTWESIERTFIVGICAYTGMIILLRVSGKRTLTKMNAFDFVVTVALGSTLATVLLSKDVALADGLLAFALLIFLQLGITWLSVRSKKFSSLIKAQPTLLVFRGEFLKEAMKAERVTEEEILSILRSNNVATVAQADAVVMETDGSLSILKKVDDFRAAGSALTNVQKLPVAKN
jgi:uncharacterized membrane protein YcaP (DUF421 family)